MRRFLLWYLPVAAALLGTAVFAAGFYSFVRGETGTPVDFVPQQGMRPGAAPSQIVAPIILGDSLARGTGDQAGLGIGGRLDDELRRRNVRAKRTINIAVNGARTGDLLRELQSANVLRLIAESNVVIVSIGGNDLWGGTQWRNAQPPDPGKTMDGVLNQIERGIRTIRAANPTARIFVVGLYNPFGSTAPGARLTPLVSRWNARLIERFADDTRVTIVQTIDIFAGHDRLALDQFHPNGEAYAIIARRIADAV